MVCSCQTIRHHRQYLFNQQTLRTGTIKLPEDILIILIIFLGILVESGLIPKPLGFRTPEGSTIRDG